MVYVLIYGIMGQFSGIDSTIYDYEKAYEVNANEKFTLHMPINMNGNKILNVYLTFFIDI